MVILMNDQKFWNERYSGSDYLYGTEPNNFLAENVDLLHGPILALSEGEGRNAVFLARRGLHVLGVDYSATGLEKAHELAKSNNVQIETQAVDLAEYIPAEEEFGSVVSIYAHLPSAVRQKLYPLIEQSLKPNGIFILEAYTEGQLTKTTGGPRDADMLMSVEKLMNEFPNLEVVFAQEIDRNVSEGEGHTGLASVVQFIARKGA